MDSFTVVSEPNLKFIVKFRAPIICRFQDCLERFHLSVQNGNEFNLYDKLLYSHIPVILAFQIAQKCGFYGHAIEVNQRDSDEENKILET